MADSAARSTMTVGDLRRAIVHLDDNTPLALWVDQIEDWGVLDEIHVVQTVAEDGTTTVEVRFR